jgi:hypothetical protein
MTGPEQTLIVVIDYAHWKVATGRESLAEGMKSPTLQ